MGLTKKEAMEAINNGKRITHRSFTSDEWVERHNGSQYVFEDEVKQFRHEFWAMRNSSAWDGGWSII